MFVMYSITPIGDKIPTCGGHVGAMLSLFYILTEKSVREVKGK